MNNKAIGIRVTPDTVFYAVVEEFPDYINLIECSKIKLPKAMSFPEQLRHIRTIIATKIANENINRAGLKLIEPLSQNKNHKRLNIEGVFQELIASGKVQTFIAGPVATISSKIQIASGDYKKYISGELNFELIEDWKTFNEEQKESLFAAIASLNL